MKRARIHLHLFRDADFDAPFDLDRLSELRSRGRSLRQCADELEVAESTREFSA